ncbi:hypothetical protein H9Q73_005188 [Fusarium xylarioides]|nr:hypothetical protein H9Q73_005188 [Fusarium xylarioides]
MTSTTRHVQSEVEFILDLPQYQTEKPYYVAGPLGKDDEPRRTNAVFETKTVDFQDLRGAEKSYTLQKDGFTYVRDELTVFAGLQSVEETALHRYANDTLQLMKGIFGTDSCWVYAYKFRSSADICRPAGVPTGEACLPDEPATKGHIDQTLDGGFRRIRRHLTPEEQGEFLGQTPPKWRFLIVNTWRPVNHPVANYPLAICHPATVDIEQDAIATDRVSPEFQGENYYLKFRSRHKWYWLSGQQPNELLIFVSFDSAQDSQTSCRPLLLLYHYAHRLDSL